MNVHAKKIFMNKSDSRTLKLIHRLEPKHEKKLHKFLISEKTTKTVYYRRKETKEGALNIHVGVGYHTL